MGHKTNKHTGESSDLSDISDERLDYRFSDFFFFFFHFAQPVTTHFNAVGEAVFLPVYTHVLISTQVRSTRMVPVTHNEQYLQRNSNLCGCFSV